MNVTMLSFPDTLGFQDPQCPHATAPATASPAPSDLLIFPAFDQWSTGAFCRRFSQALVLSLPRIWTPLDVRATLTSPGAKFTTPPNLQHTPWRTIGIGAIKVCAQVKFLIPASREGPWDILPGPGHQVVSVPTLLTGQILDFLLEAVNGNP